MLQFLTFTPAIIVLIHKAIQNINEVIKGMPKV